MNNYATPFIFYTTENDLNHIIDQLKLKGWGIRHNVSNHMLNPTIFKVSFILTKNKEQLKDEITCLMPYDKLEFGELRGLICVEAIVINEEEFYKDCDNLIKMKFLGYNGDWLGYPNFILWSVKLKEAKLLFLKNKEEEKKILEELDEFLLRNNINRYFAVHNKVKILQFHHTNLIDFVKFNPQKHFQYIKDNLELIRSLYA